MSQQTIPDSTGPNFLVNINAALTQGYKDLSSHGQCRLVYTSASVVTLIPFNGNKLLINGYPQVVPSVGVALSSAGLAATTMYYVYAYMSSGVMTLEASTTGYATDSTTGVVIKSGDATRTLVGLIYCKTAATFADTYAQRFVASYFNRRPRETVGGFSGNRTTTTVGSFAEVNGEARTEFLTWGDSATQINYFGTIWTAAATYFTIWGVAVDSTNAAYKGRAYGFAYSSAAVPLGGGISGTLGEGLHYATIVAQVSATGTGTANSHTGHSETVMI